MAWSARAVAVRQRRGVRGARGLADWLPGQGVELTPVAAASPWQNGFVESFHSRLRTSSSMALNLRTWLMPRGARGKFQT